MTKTANLRMPPEQCPDRLRLSLVVVAERYVSRVAKPPPGVFKESYGWLLVHRLLASLLAARDENHDVARGAAAPD